VNKKILSGFAVCLFLALIVQSAVCSPIDGAALNPPSRIDNIPFKQLYSTLCIAVTIYKLDAIEGNGKDVIIKEHGQALLNPDIRFDLEKIDIGKKGWTRYYPVMIGGHQFITRVFLTEERAYQPQRPVLYEMTIPDPAVTCQVLLDVNSIIKSRKIEPPAIFLDLSASRSI
jgi:hypothetical protein